jgi:hypothetical protein
LLGAKFAVLPDADRAAETLVAGCGFEATWAVAAGGSAARASAPRKPLTKAARLQRQATLRSGSASWLVDVRSIKFRSGAFDSAM